VIGEKKLNLLKVQEIKKLIKDGYPLKEIAEQFGVTRQLIWYISKGKRWGVHEYVISQKDEQMLLPSHKERIGCDILQTKACEIIGPISKLYIIITFVNGKNIDCFQFRKDILEFIPTFEDLINVHEINKYRYEKIQKQLL